MEHASGCIEVLLLAALWRKVVLHPTITLDERVCVLEAELGITLLELATVTVTVHALALRLGAQLIVFKLCLGVISAIFGVALLRCFRFVLVDSALARWLAHRRLVFFVITL